MPVFRDSHQLLHRIVKIIAEELYGFEVTLVYDSVWGDNIMRGIEAGEWDVDLESWKIDYSKLLSEVSCRLQSVSQYAGSELQTTGTQL